MAEHAYPSQSACAQRARQRLWRERAIAKKAKRKNKGCRKSPCPSDAGRPRKRRRTDERTQGTGHHRWCLRCRRRLDHCVREGCLPYKHRLAKPCTLRRFRRYRLGPALTARFHTDCVDVRCIAHWTREALPRCGAAIALFGICVHSHYNRSRTSGILLPALQAPSDAGDRRVRWGDLRRALERCTSLWGKGAGLGLYSATNLPGSGFPRERGQSRVDAMLAGFKSLYRSKGFKDAVAALTRGIADFDAHATLRGHLQAASRVSPGCIGKYHMHMVFTVLVASGWVAPRVVDAWPVGDSAGTMQGLRSIYGAGLAGRDAIEALRELWRRLAGAGELQQGEHVGTIGAQLCWYERWLKGANTSLCANRYEETTKRWNEDLADLRAAGVVLPGWHRDA